MAAARLAARARRQAFFESDAVDQLLSMILELATEVWVVRERLYTLERAANQLGLPLVAAVEKYRFSEAETQELASMRQKMLAELTRNIGRTHRKTAKTFSDTALQRRS